MWFLFGLMMGASLASGTPTPTPGPMMSGIPAECLLAETFQQYTACRGPSMYANTYIGSGLCGNYGDYIKKIQEAGACDLMGRITVEWNGLQKVVAQLRKAPAP